MPRLSTAAPESIAPPVNYRIPAALLLLWAALSGCAIHRVSVLGAEDPRTALKPEEVKLYGTFREVAAPWRLRGMVSAHLLPLMSNTVEARELLVREAAARLGAQAVVGLQDHVGEFGWFKGRSVAILASVGGAPSDDAGRESPRFIACLPPTELLADVPRELDDRIRDQLQYFLSYTHGYYTYPCGGPEAGTEAILQGKVSPAALGQPLGMEPHYALRFTIERYELVTKRKLHIMLPSWVSVGSNYTEREIRLRVSLFDLAERRDAWSASAIGTTTGPVPGEALGGGRTESEAGYYLARDALRKLLEAVPVVPGFKAVSVGPSDY